MKKLLALVFIALTAVTLTAPATANTGFECVFWDKWINVPNERYARNNVIVSTPGDDKQSRDWEEFGRPRAVERHREQALAHCENFYRYCYEINRSHVGKITETRANQALRSIEAHYDGCKGFFSTSDFRG